MAPNTDIAQLVRDASHGDQRAWDAIIHQFQGLVWSTVRGFRLTGADAADVTQTTWLKLVEHLDRIQDPARLGGWLATTARHECLRCLRTSGRTIPTDDEATLDRASSQPQPEIDADLLRDERDSALWRAFSRISERCQRLLRILAADPPPTYEDISLAFDMPIGSIGPTRQRCLDRLRVELAAEGVG